MNRLAISLYVAALFAASAGHAQTFTYADFEPTIAHLDLETCPPGLAQGDVFCRLTVHHETLHVFVFSLDGDQPFLAVRSYEPDEFAITLSE